MVTFQASEHHATEPVLTVGLSCLGPCEENDRVLLRIGPDHGKNSA